MLKHYKYYSSVETRERPCTVAESTRVGGASISQSQDVRTLEGGPSPTDTPQEPTFKPAFMWPRIFFSGNLFSLDITCVCRLRLVLGSYTLGRGRLAGLFGCGFISMNLWRSTGICDPSRGAACRREHLGRTPDLLSRQLRCQGAEGDRIPAHGP